jgi:hypothetical protein
MYNILDFSEPEAVGQKWHVREQLYPESRGWIVHTFPTRAEAEAFLTEMIKETLAA